MKDQFENPQIPWEREASTGLNSDLRDLKRRAEDLEFQRKLQNELWALEDDASVMAHLSECLQEYLGCLIFTLGRFDRNTDKFVPVFAYPILDEESLAGGLEGLWMPEERQAFMEQGSLATEDVSEEARSTEAQEVFHRLGIHSFASAGFPNQFFISVYRSQPHQWTERELDLLSSLAIYLNLRLSEIWARNALRDNQERYRKVFEHAATGIAITNHRGELEGANAAYCRLLGYDEEALRGAHFPSLIHPEDRAENMVLSEKLVAREISGFEIENRYVHRDGSAVWVRKFVSRIQSEIPEEEHFVVLASDISAQRQIRDELQQTLDRKNEFLAMLGHELRNPLAAIRHAVQVEQEDAGRLSWGLEVIDRQSLVLRKMIDDLLDVAYLIEGRVRLQMEDLGIPDILQSVAEAMRATIDSREQNFQLEMGDPNLVVRGNAIRLEQVFNNLVANASKYTQQGGRISLRAIQMGESVQVTVEDNGAGISKELLPHLFEIFEQAETTLDRSHGGLGIGLTAVKSLVELHEGAITARSDGEEQGSSFQVILPLASPARRRLSQRQKEGQKSEPSSAIRILLVDDHEDAALGLCHLLQARNYQVTLCYDGLEALALADEVEPNIFLLDLGLPGLNGYQLAASLRTDLRFAHSLMIAISGYARSSDVARSESAGFDHHLAKPLKLERLFALISEPRVE